MGQKITPYSNRLKLEKNWKSKWFSKKNYADMIKEDDKIRRYISEKFKSAGIKDIFIERSGGEVTVNIHTSRPGMIIGRSGETSENLQKDLKKIARDKIKIEISEVSKPDLSPDLLADNVAYQIEKRVAFRKAMSMALEKAKDSGARGVRIGVAGRLGGLEIARSETLSFGTIPLSTFRKRVDYAHTTANTKFGVIGVKVWVYK